MFVYYFEPEHIMSPMRDDMPERLTGSTGGGATSRVVEHFLELMDNQPSSSSSPPFSPLAKLPAFLTWVFSW